MHQAKYQLMSTTEPVFQIAEALGYSTPGYLSKVFKQATGVSPRPSTAELKRLIPQYTKGKVEMTMKH